VVDRERRVIALTSRVLGTPAKFLVKVLDQSGVCGLWQPAQVVQLLQNPRVAHEQVEQRLVVVERDRDCVYPLSGVLVLLQTEDVLVKKVLDLFIGKVDAQLLEAVLLEVLKAVDVQDAYLFNELAVVLRAHQCPVDLRHQPREHF